MDPYTPLVINGEIYLTCGNVSKGGDRLKIYLQNDHNFRFVIMSIAYNGCGDVVDGYVGIYVHEEDKNTEKYFKWTQEEILPLKC